MSQPLLVVGAVITRGGAVLACRRAPGRASAGQWEFPGGKVQPGESEPQALVRELREELGIDAQVGALLNAEVTRVGSLDIDLRCYWVTVVEAPTSSTDHDALEWVEPDRLTDYAWAKPDWPAVRAVQALGGEGKVEAVGAATTTSPAHASGATPAAGPASHGGAAALSSLQGGQS